MITLEDVKKARERISGRILRTPLLRVPALDPVVRLPGLFKTGESSADRFL